MKNLFALLAAAFIYMGAFSQSPFVINYQAVARDTGTAAPIVNQHMNARMSILNGSATGTVIYSETDTFTTTSVGLFNIRVGAGAVLSGSFSSINWSDSAKYMKVEIDPAGGSSFLTLESNQLLSVPYALYSGSSGKISGAPGDVAYYGSSGTGTTDRYFFRSDTDYTTQIIKVKNHVAEGLAIGQNPYASMGDGAYLVRYDTSARHEDIIGEFYTPLFSNPNASHVIGLLCQDSTSSAGFLLADSDPINPQALMFINNTTLSWGSLTQLTGLTSGIAVQGGTNNAVNGVFADTNTLHLLSNNSLWNWPTADGAPNETIGTDGSGNLKWSDPLAPPLVSKSSSYTLTTADYTVIFTSTGLTATLPAASGAVNRMYIIVNKAGGSLSISSYKDLSNSSNTSVAANSSVTLQSDGTAWQQIR